MKRIVGLLMVVGLALTVPVFAQADQHEKAKKDQIQLRVTESGEVMFHGKKVPMNQITPRLEKMLEKKPLPVVIRAHRKAEHSTVMAIMDAVKKAGATDVSLASHMERATTTQKSMKPDPSDHRAMGHYYYEKGRYYLMLVEFSKDYHQNPKDPKAMNNVGAAYASLGYHELAKAMWNRALEVDPKNEYASINLHRLKEQQKGDGEKATTKPAQTQEAGKSSTTTQSSK